MEFSVKSGNPEKQRTACIVLGVFESRRLSTAASQLDKASGGFLSKLLRRGDLQGRAGQSLLVHNVPGVLAERVLLVGCGKEKGFSDAKYRKSLSTAVSAVRETGAKDFLCYLTDLDVQDRDIAWKIRQAVMIVQEAFYRFDQLKSKNDDPKPVLKKIAFSASARGQKAAAEKACLEGKAIAEGIDLAKDLGNAPGNHCTPSDLADEARKLARGQRKCKVEVLDQKAMEKLGMGSLLSVAKGSRQPPKLITLQYTGASKNTKPYVFVGKGITFDAGGISLKPSPAMDEMKYDMCGAASVLGMFKACLALQLPINLVGIIPASENLPDGAANKPGDIVTSMSGQTIEILNTDAEGRLVLCDALTYAKKFNPQVVVDIATLTGACVIALGQHAAGLLGNHDPLIKDLLSAGEDCGDRAWELPLWDDYQDQLKSNFADIANIGGRDAGAITAACFLARFAEDLRWAHLDIAGAAWISGAKKGSTGRPVGLLMQYLMDKSKPKRTKG